MVLAMATRSISAHVRVGYSHVFTTKSARRMPNQSIKGRSDMKSNVRKSLQGKPTKDVSAVAILWLIVIRYWVAYLLGAVSTLYILGAYNRRIYPIYHYLETMLSVALYGSPHK